MKKQFYSVVLVLGLLTALLGMTACGAQEQTGSSSERQAESTGTSAMEASSGKEMRTGADLTLSSGQEKSGLSSFADTEWEGNLTATASKSVPEQRFFETLRGLTEYAKADGEMNAKLNRSPDTMGENESGAHQAGLYLPNLTAANLVFGAALENVVVTAGSGERFLENLVIYQMHLQRDFIPSQWNTEVRFLIFNFPDTEREKADGILTQIEFSWKYAGDGNAVLEEAQKHPPEKWTCFPEEDVPAQRWEKYPEYFYRPVFVQGLEEPLAYTVYWVRDGYFFQADSIPADLMDVFCEREKELFQFFPLQ